MVNHTYMPDLSPLSAIMSTQLKHTDGIAATMLMHAFKCSMTIDNAKVKSRNSILNDLINPKYLINTSISIPNNTIHQLIPYLLLFIYKFYVFFY